MKNKWMKSASILEAGVMMYGSAAQIFAAEPGSKAQFSQSDYDDFYDDDYDGFPYWNKHMCKQQVLPPDVKPGNFYIVKTVTPSGIGSASSLVSFLDPLFAAKTYRLIKVVSISGERPSKAEYYDCDTGETGTIDLYSSHYFYKIPSLPY
ncbi:MAG: hypothetical protein HUJ54_10110 [Erysipelotrichaceae bacterium]|nr:hypothetical protein [Erysipelotrichaceae bacterium]